MSEALKLAQEIVTRHTGCEGTKGCNVCQIPRALIDLQERMGKIAEEADWAKAKYFSAESPASNLAAILALTKGKS